MKAAELKAGDALVVRVVEVFDTGHGRVQVKLGVEQSPVVWYDADAEITASRSTSEEGWPEPAPLPADYWETAE